jgi:DNA-binding MarR family transcriptional regulator
MLLDEREGCRLTTVSDRLLVARSTITRIIDQLEQAGLVRRAADPHDRRAQRAILTPAGVKRREAAQEAHRSSLERRMQALDSAEHAHLGELLDKLREALQADLKAS